MGNFAALAIVILYLYPDTSSHKGYIFVNIFGGVAFLFFCFIMIIHLQSAVKHFTWYSKFIKALKIKFDMKNDWNPLQTIAVHHKSVRENIKNSNHSYNYLQESLLEQFN